MPQKEFIWVSTYNIKLCDISIDEFNMIPNTFIRAYYLISVCLTRVCSITMKGYLVIIAFGLFQHFIRFTSVTNQHPLIQ